MNLNEETIEIYREPHFTGYGSKIVLHSGDELAPHAFSDAVVSIAELLKRESIHDQEERSFRSVLERNLLWLYGRGWKIPFASEC